MSEMTGEPRCLAHNSARSGPNGEIPVIIEPRPDVPPPLDIDDWHDATAEEYGTYLAYWNAMTDVEEGRAPVGTDPEYRRWYAHWLTVIAIRCDRCGDVSNSAPDLMCGRVDDDSADPPCTGTYRRWIPDEL